MEGNKFATKEEYEAKKKEFEGVVYPIFGKYGAGGAPGGAGMPGGFPGGFPGAGGMGGMGGAAPAAGAGAGPAVDDLD